MAKRKLDYKMAADWPGSEDGPSSLLINNVHSIAYSTFCASRLHCTYVLRFFAHLLTNKITVHNFYPYFFHSLISTVRFS